MAKFQSEFSLLLTEDEINVGSCIVCVEADSHQDAVDKIRVWLLANIDALPDDTIEIDEFPKSAIVVGQKSRLSQIMELVEAGVPPFEALEKIDSES